MPDRLVDLAGDPAPTGCPVCGGTACTGYPDIAVHDTYPFLPAEPRPEQGPPAPRRGRRARHGPVEDRAVHGPDEDRET